MCKKLIFIFCVLAMASISYAEVIGDWGSGMDGWVNEWGLTTSDSTIGATLGSGSLKVEAVGGWYQGAMDKVLTAGQVNMIATRAAGTFSIDVTRFAADWTPGAWGWWTPESRLFFSISAGAQNEDGDWAYWGAGQEVLGANWYPTSIGALYGNDQHYPGNTIAGMTPDGTMTATWSFAAVQDAVDAMAASGFNQNLGMDIRLIVNAPDYYNATYYLDNAQIPEPATMTLLILGGLTLIRRKH